MGLTRRSSEGTPAAPCLSLASFTRAFHSRLPGRRFCRQAVLMVRTDTCPELLHQPCANYKQLGSGKFQSVVIAVTVQHGSFQAADMDMWSCLPALLPYALSQLCFRPQ